MCAAKYALRKGGLLDSGSRDIIRIVDRLVRRSLDSDISSRSRLESCLLDGGSWNVIGVPDSVPVVRSLDVTTPSRVTDDVLSSGWTEVLSDGNVVSLVDTSKIDSGET